MNTIQELIRSCPDVSWKNRALMPGTDEVVSRYSSGSMYEYEDIFRVYSVAPNGDMVEIPECVGHWEEHAWAYSNRHDRPAQRALSTVAGTVAVLRHGRNYCPDMERDESWESLTIYQ